MENFSISWISSASEDRTARLRLDKDEQDFPKVTGVTALGRAKLEKLFNHADSITSSPDLSQSVYSKIPKLIYNSEKKKVRNHSTRKEGFWLIRKCLIELEMPQNIGESRS